MELLEQNTVFQKPLFAESFTYTTVYSSSYMYNEHTVMYIHYSIQ